MKPTYGSDDGLQDYLCKKDYYDADDGVCEDEDDSESGVDSLCSSLLRGQYAWEGG